MEPVRIANLEVGDFVWIEFHAGIGVGKVTGPSGLGDGFCFIKVAGYPKEISLHYSFLTHATQKDYEAADLVEG